MNTQSNSSLPNNTRFQDKSNTLDKKTQNTNNNEYEDSEYDRIEEDEGEMDVSEEIKNENNDNKYNATENFEDKNKSGNEKIMINSKEKATEKNESDIEIDALLSSSSQKKNIHENQQTQEIDLNEETNENKVSDGYIVDYYDNESRFSRYLKQEFSQIADASVFQSSFLQIPTGFYLLKDLLFEDTNEESYSHSYSHRRRRHRKNTIENEERSTSYTENLENPEEEEVNQINQQRRRHKRKKYENDNDDKQAENYENTEEEESNRRHRKRKHRQINSENEEEEEKLTNKEYENEQKAKFSFEEEESEKEIFNFEEGEKEKDEEKENKDEEEKKSLFEIEEEEEEENYTTKGKYLSEENEEEEEKVENKKNDLFREERIENENDKEEDKNEIKKDQDLLTEKEGENGEKIDNKEQILFEEEEEENHSKDLHEEEEEKIQSPIKNSFDDNEEKAQNTTKDSFSEEEEKEKSSKDLHKEAANDSFGEEEDSKQYSKGNEATISTNVYEEEANETVSCIPSDQFDANISISPISKEKKAKNIDEERKNAFKQRILQQFSNEEEDEYSDKMEPKVNVNHYERKYPNSDHIPQVEISSSIITQTETKTVDENGEIKEQSRKKIRRRKIQKIELSQNIDDQIGIQKVDNSRQKPKINKRTKKRGEGIVHVDEDIGDVFDISDIKDSFMNEPNKANQIQIMTTPKKTKKIKKRARSAQKPPNKDLSTETPTEIEIPSFKSKKSKVRSQSVRIKRSSKKLKKGLADMSTQTDKFQIDENQIFIFEKIKNMNTYQFNNNNSFLEVESENLNRRETETEDTYHPAINKRKKKNSPIKKKKVSAKINDRIERGDDQISQNSIVKKKRPRKRNLSEQPRKRLAKSLKISDDGDTDDNIVIDFGDTMYGSDQQFNPQLKIEARKKEEKVNTRYNLKRKPRNKKSSPIRLLAVSTNNDFPESELSDVFRDDDDDENYSKRTNHQWDIDNLCNKNKTLKTQSKSKPKAKTRSKKRSKSVSLITQKNNNSIDRESEDERERETVYNNAQVLPAIKKRNPKKRQQQVSQLDNDDDSFDVKNNYDNDNNNRFSYEGDIKNQKRPKGNGLKSYTVDLLNNHFPIPANRRSLIKGRAKKVNKSGDDRVEVTDSIAYETEFKSISNRDYSSDSNSEYNYEAPKELFDGLLLSFRSSTWDAALNGIYSMDILKCKPDE